MLFLKTSIFCAFIFLQQTELLFAHGNEQHAPVSQTKMPTPRPANDAPILEAPTPPVPPNIAGHWGPVDENWPVLAVHATLLPNRKVLAWDATPDDFDLNINTHETLNTRVTLWSPPSSMDGSGSHTLTYNRTGTDLFCAGSAHLWDGRILFSGGDTGPDNTNGPSIHSNIYDYTNNTWERADDMETPRWYSSVVALSSGEMLTFGGTYNPKPYAELFGLDKLWHAMVFGAQYGANTTGDYQWAQIGPNGNVFIFGPHQDIVEISTENGGQLNFIGKREIQNPLYRSYGSYAMYDSRNGRVLVAGGGKTDATPVSTNSTILVELKKSDPQNWYSQVYVSNTELSPMNYGRRQLNLTILADQSVLATGGHKAGNNLVNLNIKNQANFAELWSPETREWTLLSQARRSRQYHSVALLLPDATVLTGGGGYCGDCSQFGYYENNAEIFYPPYLFEPGSHKISEDRPQITNIPNETESNHLRVDYNSQFTVTSNQSERIRKITLVKLGSVTHSQNQDQRAMSLDFTLDGNQLKVLSPAHRHIAPPGHYMLFIINEKGIPSIAQIINVGQPLLSSGKLLIDRVLENKWNYYKIKKNNLKALRLTLMNTSGKSKVYLASGKIPTEQENDCHYDSDNNNNMQICSAQSENQLDWYIGVFGEAKANFSLMAENIQYYQAPDNEEPPITTPPTNDPENVLDQLYDSKHTHEILTNNSTKGYQEKVQVFYNAKNCPDLKSDVDKAIAVWSSVEKADLQIVNAGTTDLNEIDTYLYKFEEPSIVVTCSKSMLLVGRTADESFGMADANDSDSDGFFDKGRIILNNESDGSLNYFTQNDDTRKKVMIHFLGHALGLGHDTDNQSVMHERINDTSLTLSDSDTKNLRKLYGDGSDENAGCNAATLSNHQSNGHFPIHLILLLLPLILLVNQRFFLHE